MSIQHQLGVVEQEYWFKYMRDRWGLPEAFFDGFVLTTPNVKTISIVASGIEPLVTPVPKAVGIPFLRVNMMVPKPTTGAALWFGPAATRNFLDLSEDQTDRVLRRESWMLSSDEVGECTNGYVLVRCRQMTVSIGYLKDGMLSNMHPKAWSLAPGVSAFRV